MFAFLVPERSHAAWADQIDHDNETKLWWIVLPFSLIVPIVIGICFLWYVTDMLTNLLLKPACYWDHIGKATSSRLIPTGLTMEEWLRSVQISVPMTL